VDVGDSGSGGGGAGIEEWWGLPGHRPHVRFRLAGLGAVAPLLPEARCVAFYIWAAVAAAEAGVCTPASRSQF
jgi:hypothetical protein